METPLRPLFALAAISLALSARADQLDDFMQKQAASPRFAGASVCVIRDGKVVAARGFGKANLETETPATADTVYELASVTKQFTATAIMMLAGEGKLSLDDSVQERLPSVPKAWSGVKVRHLLNRTSGIKSYTSLPGFMANSRKDYTHDELVKLVADIPLEFKPGEKHAYSNTGYFLLGMIIEKVCGKPYGEFLAERIFKPLGMASTRVNSFQEIIKRRASGYSMSPTGLRPCEYVSPTQPFAAGALVSTVSDIAKWNAALNSNALLPQAVLEKMWTATRLEDGSTVPYGFGWSVSKTGSHRVIGHGGGIPGFSTQIDRYPDDRLSVIVLSNSDAVNAGSVARQIAALYVPALAPKPQAAALDAGKHEETTRLVRDLLTRTAKGRLNPDVFTDEMRKALFLGPAADAKRVLAAMGPLKSLTLLNHQVRGGLRAFKYRAVFGDTAVICHCAIDDRGKVAGLGISPE